jgi:fucose permease
LLCLSCLGFAALGLPDGVLGVAWPSLRASFALPLDALGALLVATTVGYVVSSAASGRILARMRLGTLLALSCTLTALALCGYALAPSWLAIVALGALAGLGAGAIDAGINLYAATHHSARTLGLLHAGYGLGTSLGPAIMTPLLMAGPGWRAGYAALAVGQLALALAFTATRRRWPPLQRAATPAAAGAPLARTLGLREARLGMAGFFVYVGIEAAAGAWLYSLLVGARGASMASAGAAVTTYWGGLLVGRVLLAMAPERLEPGAVLRVATAALALAAALLALDLGSTANAAAIAALGLAAGPIFPSLITATPRRVAPAHAANAVGVCVAAAAAGQSLLPAGIGAAADALGLEAIPALLAAATLLLCFILHLHEAAPPARNRAGGGWLSAANSAQQEMALPTQRCPRAIRGAEPAAPGEP